MYNPEHLSSQAVLQEHNEKAIKSLMWLNHLSESMAIVFHQHHAGLLAPTA